MSNHVNIFDPFLIFSRLPLRSKAIEEESHFKWPVYGWVVKRLGLIPINRKSGQKAMKSLIEAANLVKQGKTFPLFCFLKEPEQ